MKRLPVPISILLIIFVVFVTVISYPPELSGQGNTRKTESKDGLIPVPNPLLDHLEKVVNQQLSEKRQELDALAGKPGVSSQQLALAYGELGQLYHAYELTEVAGPCYRNAIALDPTNLEWQYSLGYLLQTIGQYSEAIELYKKIITGGQKPNLDYLVFIRTGECHRSLNQPEQAKKAIEAAFFIHPEWPAVLARLGEIALAEKRYDEAIKYLESALEKQPAADKLHYSLGMAYRGAGDMEKARHHMSKYGMVDVQPPDPVKTRFKKLIIGYHTHLLAGKLAFSAKRYSEAIELFQLAIEADPEKPGAKVDLGAALSKLGKYKQAVEQFQAALKVAPGNVAAHFNLGKLYIFFADFEKAIEHLQIVVDKNPKDAEAHLLLADALRNTRRFAESFEHYKTALKYEPALTSGWLDISKLFSLAGQHKEALQILEDAYNRMPHNNQIVHALAHRLAASPDLTLRRGQRALELAMQAFQAAENYEHARTVAISYAQLERCDEAVEWMEKTIELATKSKQPKTVLEVLQRNLTHFKTQRPCRTPGGPRRGRP